MKKPINNPGQAIVKLLAEQRETLERIEKQIDFMSEGVKEMREDIKQMRQKIRKKIPA